MGANINPNSSMQAFGKIFSGVQDLLQAVGGGTAQPAQQPAQAARPVDQFQAAAPAQAAPAQAGAAQGAQPAAGGDLASTMQQLVQALTSVVQMLQQLLGGKGAAAGGAAAGGAAAGGAAAAATATAGGAQASASASASASAGAGAKGDAFSQLQQQFGEWHGKGKNSSAPTGPQAKKLVAEAQSKLSSGDVEGAKKCYSDAQKTGSPVMLDLNGDGKLGTTGVSTAKDRADGQTGKMVDFDLNGDGKKEKVEWMDGKGDGMLVDDTGGAVTAASKGNGDIDGTKVFGDQGGKFGNGYEKMKQHDTNGDGKLTGAELQNLKVWVDNGDAKVGQGELKSLAELGITEMNVGMNTTQNARGENLMQSSFVQNGQQKLTEDVWFAKK